MNLIDCLLSTTLQGPTKFSPLEFVVFHDILPILSHYIQLNKLAKMGSKTAKKSDWLHMPAPQHFASSALYEANNSDERIQKIWFFLVILAFPQVQAAYIRLNEDIKFALSLMCYTVGAPISSADTMQVIILSFIDPLLNYKIQIDAISHRSQYYLSVHFSPRCQHKYIFLTSI